MSAAEVITNTACKTGSVWAALTLAGFPVSGPLASRFTVKSASRLERVAGLIPDSAYRLLHGACAGNSRGEKDGISICKPLQALISPRIATNFDAFTSSDEISIALIFNSLRVYEKVTAVRCLANSLRALPRDGNGHDSLGYVKSGAHTGSGPRWMRNSSPFGRGSMQRLPRANARSGFVIPRSRGWRIATGTKTAGVELGSPGSPQHYVGY